MSTVQEIRDAIRALPQKDRQELAEDMLTILPEINGDAEWRRIIDDPRPSKTLSALADEIDSQMKATPEAYPIITDKDFERS
jgi:hypothetical protein